MILANEMIDAVEPGDDVESDEALTDVIQSIKTMENKLMDLIGKIKNEDMMNFALLLNDDIQKTIRSEEHTSELQSDVCSSDLMTMSFLHLKMTPEN